VKFLLDTQIFLWALLQSHKLRGAVRKALEDVDNSVYVSAASLWEISIKQGIGKLTLPGEAAIYLPQRIEQNGFTHLPITHVHALAIGSLPPHHNDPFDRMLVAQAQIEGCTLISADRALRLYDVRRLEA